MTGPSETRSPIIDFKVASYVDCASALHSDSDIGRVDTNNAGLVTMVDNTFGSQHSSREHSIDHTVHDDTSIHSSGPSAALNGYNCPTYIPSETSFHNDATLASRRHTASNAIEPDNTVHILTSHSNVSTRGNDQIDIIAGTYAHSAGYGSAGGAYVGVSPDRDRSSTPLSWPTYSNRPNDQMPLVMAGTRTPPDQWQADRVSFEVENSGAGKHAVGEKITLASPVHYKPVISALWPRPSQELVDKYPSFAHVYTSVCNTALPNYLAARLPLESNMIVEAWREALHDYHDYEVCEFVNFGWPVGYTAPLKPTPTLKNHQSALDYPRDIDKFIEKEQRMGALLGPFDALPFEPWTQVSPLMTAPKRDSRSC